MSHLNTLWVLILIVWYLLLCLRSALNKHVQMKHEGVKVQCEMCSYSASDRSTLKAHIKSKHEGVRYPCSLCDYQATQKGNLKTHMMRKHSECDDSDASMTYKTNASTSAHDISLMAGEHSSDNSFQSNNDVTEKRKLCVNGNSREENSDTSPMEYPSFQKQISQTISNSVPVSFLSTPINSLPSSINSLPGSMGSLPASMGSFPGSISSLPASMGSLPGSINCLPAPMGSPP